MCIVRCSSCAPMARDALIYASVSMTSSLSFRPAHPSRTRAGYISMINTVDVVITLRAGYAGVMLRCKADITDVMLWCGEAGGGVRRRAGRRETRDQGIMWRCASDIANLLHYLELCNIRQRTFVSRNDKYYAPFFNSSFWRTLILPPYWRYTF